VLLVIPVAFFSATPSARHDFFLRQIFSFYVSAAFSIAWFINHVQQPVGLQMIPTLAICSIKHYLHLDSFVRSVGASASAPDGIGPVQSSSGCVPNPTDLVVYRTGLVEADLLRQSPKILSAIVCGGRYRYLLPIVV